MSSLKVYACKDKEYIDNLITSDEIWARVADDYSVKKGTADKGDCLWLVCVKDGVNVGLALIDNMNNSSLDVHITIEKKFRGKGTIEIGKAFISWLEENSPDKIRKLNAKVACTLKDVIRFAKALGFVIEGVDTKSMIKNGNLIDRICLGLSIRKG